MKNNGVMILDFGSQYTKLIARRVREENIYSEIFKHNISIDEVNRLNPAAIILSGGPSSVFLNNALKIDPEILKYRKPILGICYGLQLLIHSYGGNVEEKNSGEYGMSKLNLDNSHNIFSNVPNEINTWMSHMDQVTKIPSNWRIVARSTNEIIAAVSNQDSSRIGLQFHPEVIHSEYGKTILRNFLVNIADCSTGWNANNYVKDQTLNIKNEVGNDKLIIGVSGGVDSTVAAALIHKAIGNQSTAVLIVHGLMRKNEAKTCVSALKKSLDVNIHSFDESDIFSKDLIN